MNSSANRDALLSDLTGDFDSVTGFDAIDLGSGKLTIVKTDGTAFAKANVSETLEPDGTATPGTTQNKQFDLTGPANLGDTWSFNLNGTQLAPGDTIATGESITTLATGFASQAAAATGYTAYRDGSRVVVVRLANTAFTMDLSVTRDPTLATGDIVGTPDLDWTQAATVDPALNVESTTPKVKIGDRWAITVDGQVFQIDINNSGQQSISSVAQRLADLIDTSSLLTNIDADDDGDEIIVARTSGDPVTVGPLTELRAAAYGALTDVDDERTHYKTAEIRLEPREYQAGETWVITLDGEEFRYAAAAGLEPRAAQY